ncbi:MAG: hypothetical protein U0Q14_03495 [Dermatophilaceae bacterium]|jgi:hypothetical protein|nr:hypothetical protein [Candidatus Lutibacillus vidarii]HON74578.1 hypothetical protein [Dermatophilaceae bacterium]HRC00745.1 hypothetical protein [Dermatophilaceae bacterium]
MTSPTPRDDAPLIAADRVVGAAPLPTEKTLKARRNLVIQAGRFVLLNARIMKMVLKGHH